MQSKKLKKYPIYQNSSKEKEKNLEDKKDIEVLKKKLEKLLESPQNAQKLAALLSEMLK